MIMLINVMKLLFKAFERWIVARSIYPGGYESEWYVFTRTGGTYKIKNGEHVATLDKETLPVSTHYKNFKSLLNKFLDLSFPR